MRYVIFFPDENAMVSAGFGIVAEVPVIFDENWCYHREASRYLRDRSKGEASIVGTDVIAFPARSSMGQYAYKLTDFLAWCDWVGRSWKEVEYYRDLVQRYQDHMLKGHWAAERGHKLSPSTVNGRVDEAVWFCKWAANRGLREELKILTKATHRKVGGTRSNSHKSIQLETRTGKARPKPIRLRIPNPAMVDAWLQHLYREKGETKGLMGELILRTAIRRQEAEQWRTTYLVEDRNQWEVTGDSVSVLLKYGTKGGKQRYIDVPIDLAERLGHYQQVTRPKLRMRYVYAAKSKEEMRLRVKEREERMFLSVSTGTPQTARKLYLAWKEVSVQPIEGWSPHLGRHYWTCMKLLEEHNKRLAMQANGSLMAPDWATALARDDLLMHVKPQLGHLDAKTTEGYCVWLGKMLRSAKGNEEWIESLEIHRSAAEKDDGLEET